MITFLNVVLKGSRLNCKITFTSALLFEIGLVFLTMGHSTKIHQIYAKSKILKSLKYSPFDSLIENRK